MLSLLVHSPQYLLWKISSDSYVSESKVFWSSSDLESLIWPSIRGPVLNQREWLSLSLDTGLWVSNSCHVMNWMYWRISFLIVLTIFGRNYVGHALMQQLIEQTWILKRDSSYNSSRISVRFSSVIRLIRWHLSGHPKIWQPTVFKTDEKSHLNESVLFTVEIICSLYRLTHSCALQFFHLFGEFEGQHQAALKIMGKIAGTIQFCFEETVIWMLLSCIHFTED